MSDESEDAGEASDADERAQIEAVFRLGGGELEDKDWTPRGSSEKFPEGDECDWRFRFWYEGPPEYAARDLIREHGVHLYRTVIRDCLFGLPPESVTDDDGYVWTRVAHFVSSGETECPSKDWEDEPERTEDCPLCEAAPDEEHGYVYLGDGWCEVVYMSKEPDEEPEDEGSEDDSER